MRAAASQPTSLATTAAACRRWLLALVLGLLPLVAGTAMAADVSVRAQLDRTQIEVGDSANLSVEVRGAQNAPAPAIAGVDGVSINYVGPSTQVSIVNGQISASITHNFSVTALKAGTFTIGPIRVDYGGKQYDAGSVTLRAVAGNAPQSGGSAAAAGGQALRLVLSVPKTDIYLHERIPVTLKLYVGQVRVSDLQYPTVTGDGFALDKFPQPSQHQEGAYQVVDFATTLTALRTGTLTIGPAKMGLSVISQRRVHGGDPFMRQFFDIDPFGTTRRPMQLQSDALHLNVLPLPEAGKPADFSGAVGHFDFDVKAAPLKLQAGDPVTITMTVRGAGNFDNVTSPAIPGSDKLRVYPVQSQPAPNAQEKVFEQVVIPQQAGAVTLPELRFSYFDPRARAYRTVQRGPIALTVRPSAQAQAAPQIVGAAPAAPQRDEEKLGRDIVFIKDTPGTFIPIGSRLYRSLWFWLLQPLPLLAWIGAVLYDRRRQRLTGDVRYARFTRAGREARQAIAGARSAMQAGDRSSFYDSVARAVSDYLAAKLDLPPGSVSADSVAARLRANGTAPELTQVADSIQEFFATCEQVRFAPSAASDGDMQRTLERADAIIGALERRRKLNLPAAAALVLLASLALASLAAAAPQASSPNTLFFHANALYTDEHYAQAAADYEKILAGGHESGNLYFNLGNAYFKAGDRGRAILNYERALRLIPADPDLNANLGYARSLSGESDGEPIYARLLFPLADRMTSDGLLLGASLVYTALMLLLILGRLLPATRRIAARSAIVAACLLAVLLSSGGYRLLAVDLPPYAVVVADKDTTVRFEPSDNGTMHYTAKPGTMLRILAEREGWAQVSRSDGQRGWVEAKALARL